MTANDPALGITALEVMRHKGPQDPARQTNVEAGWEF